MRPSRYVITRAAIASRCPPWIIPKYLITAAVAVIVSEVAKRSDRAAALITALPLVTLLALIWLHVEKQSTARIVNYAWCTFWYAVFTLPMLLAFPRPLARFGFWPALAISAVCFALCALAVKPFGIKLL